MRRSAGEAVRLFNGRDGEWEARDYGPGAGQGRFTVETLVRPQADDADVWLMFAVLKRDTTDMVVQKATELGVSAFLPVFTERTNAARVNADRLEAIAVEAAEQSERLTVPLLHPARPLHEALADWPADRLLFAATGAGGCPAFATRARPRGTADRPGRRPRSSGSRAAGAVRAGPSGFARAADFARRDGGDCRSGLVAGARLWLVPHSNDTQG